MDRYRFVTIFEKAAHQPVLVTSHWYEAVQSLWQVTEVAPRQEKASLSLKATCRSAQQRGDQVLALEMRDRISHAHDRVGPFADDLFEII
jgi:hypothetical protein